jgi:hypothetical protein
MRRVAINDDLAPIGRRLVRLGPDCRKALWQFQLQGVAALAARADSIRDALQVPPVALTAWHVDADDGIELDAWRESAVDFTQSFGAVDGLLAMVHGAFAHHGGVRLTPDDLLRPLQKAFAVHCSLHRNELQAYLGLPSAPAPLTVPDPDTLDPRFVVDQVGQHLGPDLATLVGVAFSTSTATTALAAALAPLDPRQDAFDLVLYSACGIPFVDLVGSDADWTAFVAKVTTLATIMGEPFWAADVVNVATAIAATAHTGRIRPDDDADGTATRRFWDSMYKHDARTRESGELGVVTGWLNVFYPYADEQHRFMPVRAPDAPFGRRCTSDFPASSLSAAAVNDGTLKLWAGQVAVAYDRDANVSRCVWGWALASSS